MLKGAVKIYIKTIYNEWPRCPQKVNAIGKVAGTKIEPVTRQQPVARALHYTEACNSENMLKRVCTPE